MQGPVLYSLTILGIFVASAVLNLYIITPIAKSRNYRNLAFVVPPVISLLSFGVLMNASGKFGGGYTESWTLLPLFFAGLALILVGSVFNFCMLIAKLREHSPKKDK